MPWRKPAQGAFDPEKGFGVFGFPVFFLAALASVFLFPRFADTVCRFRAATGIPCPTCGSSRALMLLFRGRIFQGFLQQPLVVSFGAAYALFAAYAGIVVFGRLPRYRPERSPRPRTVLLLAGLLIAANWFYLVQSVRTEGPRPCRSAACRCSSN